MFVGNTKQYIAVFLIIYSTFAHKKHTIDADKSRVLGIKKFKSHPKSDRIELIKTLSLSPIGSA
jgi:hypothetical protein